jgi:peptidoglycan hydrolase-like protein with peptidoglycan-binding domain
MRIAAFGLLTIGLVTAGCGSDQQERTATGGLTGAGVGALVGGPIGALVGAGVGAAGGAAAPEGADTLAEQALKKERSAGKNALADAGLAPRQASAQVRQAQAELQHENLYSGKIDGVLGPQTRQAISDYQQRQGLRQTATLDRDTLERLNLAAAQNRSEEAATSGSSIPPATGNAEANPSSNPAMSGTNND